MKVRTRGIVASLIACWLIAIFYGQVQMPAIAAIIGSDDRKTFEQYAAEAGTSVSEIERKFSATGVINCDGYRATAQVTAARTVITTAGHLFWDGLSCKSVKHKRCHFEIHERQKIDKVPVDLASLRLPKCISDDVNTDWAVLNLARPVDNIIVPYALPPPGTRPRKMSVIQASGYSKTFRKGTKHPRHIMNCSFRDVDVFPGYPIQTDCDCSPGTSGSANLAETGGSLVMMAITVNDTVGSDGSHYDTYSKFNLATPVWGDFRKAIEAAMEGRR